MPYAWMRRAFGYLINKNKRIETKSKLKAIANPGEDAMTHYEMMKIMGLKK